MKVTPSAQGNVGADGSVTLTLGPVPVGHTWHARRLSVSCTGVATPVAKVYDGAVDDSRFVDGTYTGNQDTTDFGGGETFPPGTAVIVQFSGATPGATATAVMVADQEGD